MVDWVLKITKAATVKQIEKRRELLSSPDEMIYMKVKFGMGAEHTQDTYGFTCLIQ
jgi:hypothetical protein